MLQHETHGRGPDVVFLHSFPLDRTMWSGQLVAVGAAGCRAHLLDLPGFGASALPAGAAPSIDTYAHAVLSTLDAIGVERATFVGLSLGGYVALALHDLAPQRVAGLVLADTRAAPDDPATRTSRIVNLALVRDHGVEALVAKMLPHLLAPGSPESVRARVRRIGGGQSREAVTFALLAMRDRPDRSSALAKVQAPTLVLVGEHDGITAPAEMRAMAARVAGARFEVIPEAGHLANLDAPERFNEALGRYLAGATRSPR